MHGGTRAWRGGGCARFRMRCVGLSQLTGMALASGPPFFMPCSEWYVPVCQEKATKQPGIFFMSATELNAAATHREPSRPPPPADSRRRRDCRRRHTRRCPRRRHHRELRVRGRALVVFVCRPELARRVLCVLTWGK